VWRHKELTVIRLRVTHLDREATMRRVGGVGQNRAQFEVGIAGERPGRLANLYDDPNYAAS